MSTQRGNVSRKRAQKYKNRTVFKNDLHDKTPQQKKLNSLQINEVCAHCKGVIEWKIKYKKYKPLTQAKTCTKCHQRNVLKAYHVICRSCALSNLICAKCLQSTQELILEAAKLSPVEQLKLEAEMKRMSKTLPERKRRAFVRFMRRGKEINLDEYREKFEESDEKQNDASEKDNCLDYRKETDENVLHRIPYKREELLLKLEELKLSINDDEDEQESSDDGDSFNTDEDDHYDDEDNTGDK